MALLLRSAVGLLCRVTSVLHSSMFPDSLYLGEEEHISLSRLVSSSSSGRRSVVGGSGAVSVMAM